MTLTPTPPSTVLGFVWRLVLNSTLTDEQRLLELRLEILYWKVKALCGGLIRKEFPAEEATEYFDTLEECVCCELRGWIGRWKEETGLLQKKKDSVFGGGRPKTVISSAISSPRGVSSRAWDKELSYFQEEWSGGVGQPGDREMDALELVARSALNCACLCDFLGRIDSWKFGSGTTRRKTMDRRGVG